MWRVGSHDQFNSSENGALWLDLLEVIQERSITTSVDSKLLQKGNMLCNTSGSHQPGRTGPEPPLMSFINTCKLQLCFVEMFQISLFYGKYCKRAAAGECECGSRELNSPAAFVHQVAELDSPEVLKGRPDSLFYSLLTSANSVSSWTESEHQSGVVTALHFVSSEFQRIDRHPVAPEPNLDPQRLPARRLSFWQKHSFICDFHTQPALWLKEESSPGVFDWRFTITPEVEGRTRNLHPTTAPPCHIFPLQPTHSFLLVMIPDLGPSARLLDWFWTLF